MEVIMYENQIGFFYLNAGESAVVRILSTTVDKIERRSIHVLHVDGKKKSVACLSKDCPLCEHYGPSNERLYVHLWDYTDNSEKVWNRTTNEKFMNMLRDVEENWGNLSDCVVKITREGDDFPSYTLSVQNPSKYPPVDESYIDEQIAYRYSLYRSASELRQFIETGVLPAHKKSTSNKQWVPKDEWVKQQNAKKEAAELEDAHKAYEAAHANKEYTRTACANPCDTCASDDDADDPFIDPFSHHRRV